MPETCENWLGHVKSCVHYAHHTREIWGSFEIYWVRQ